MSILFVLNNITIRNKGLKMKYNQCLDIIEKNIGERPPHAEIARILKCNPTTLVNRASRDSVIKDDEIEILEKCYGFPILNNTNCIDLDYFSDVWASCGTGAVVFEETSEKLSVPTSLIQNYSKTNRYSVINSRGDSMTPFIQDRDKLIVEHWNGGQIIDNCIYVFRYANELFVKRLVKNVTQIVIKSDNPLYEPIKITDKDQDFEVIGQIVGLMRDLR